MKLAPIASAPLMRQPVDSRSAESKPEALPERRGQVSLSTEALAAANDKNEVWALHARTYGAGGLGNQVGNEYRALGEENFKRIQPPVHYGPAEAERFGKTLEYLASIEKLTDVEMEFDKNPFWGMRRDDLAAIEIDEQNYTKEERYAASRAKYNMDRLYFSRLIEYANNTGDDRPLIKGYLEFLDSITPVERLNYPTDERDKVAARLARAEREQGSLPENFSLWKYINWDPKGRLNLEALLDPSKTEPAPALEAGPAEDHGSSRLR
ncbi:hypothetical protein [Pseudomonas oryzicola]|uniref:Uncharacterized protein n=1 Tax=Pseudomonas oryzicola TaxID=485876 RepID=A0ABS6QHL9_9PSED|nr:hypothetical protein [Pseudomonas oryzicola]MBV4493419.1 hypothetical protein [Pseudomonas oryzicola]